EHFEQKGGPGGTLTDFKVALKKDGISRRFGFVGYKTEQEALAAKEWFDKTYIDSTKISVSVIEGAKDAPAPRPNKRPRLGPSPTDDAIPEKSDMKSKKTDVETKTKTKTKTDEQFDKFMEVMQPRNKKGPSWANDQTVEPPVIPIPPESNVEEDTPMIEDTTA
ncbi:hypothetical protein H0H93_002332, partial [Arthromyces matolae]